MGLNFKRMERKKRGGRGLKFMKSTRRKQSSWRDQDRRGGGVQKDQKKTRGNK